MRTVTIEGQADAQVRRLHDLARRRQVDRGEQEPRGVEEEFFAAEEHPLASLRHDAEPRVAGGGDRFRGQARARDAQARQVGGGTIARTMALEQGAQFIAHDAAKKALIALGNKTRGTTRGFSCQVMRLDSKVKSWLDTFSLALNAVFCSGNPRT